MDFEKLCRELEINAETIAAFVETLAVAEAVKEEIRQVSPSTYTGI